MLKMINYFRLMINDFGIQKNINNPISLCEFEL